MKKVAREIVKIARILIIAKALEDIEEAKKNIKEAEDQINKKSQLGKEEERNNLIENKIKNALGHMSRATIDLHQELKETQGTPKFFDVIKIKKEISTNEGKGGLVGRIRHIITSLYGNRKDKISEYDKKLKPIWTVSEKKPELAPAK